MPAIADAFEQAQAARINPETGVDSRALRARQVRLFIENSPIAYPFAVAFGILITAAFVWLLAPEEHPAVALWAALIVATLLARVVGWTVFLRANPGDEAIGPWLKWFLVPQLCSMILIGASPFFFLPASPAADFDVLLIISSMVFLAGFASSLKLSAYRPAIALLLVPTFLTYEAAVLRLPGLASKLLALGGLVTGVLGYLLASRINRAFVQSMELSVRNEQLVTALERRTIQLERQTRAAEQAQESAQRAEREKTRFLAAASHDLRQPMHAISLLVGMLRSRASGGEREVVERLERSVEAMDALFETILDLSKLDAGAMNPVAVVFPLRAIFDSIEVHFAPQAGSKKLALNVFPTRAIVRTDRAVLERLLRNLVSNAIKYTRAGEVLVGCRRHGERLRIGVWDTGVGIAPENLGRVFEEYFQVGDSPRDRAQGLGLGLSIVRRLARLLDSRVEVASELGRGSRFEIEVPFVGYAPAEAQPRADTLPPDETLGGRYILVVDDEIDVRFGTEALLRGWGCRSASAGSLEELTVLLERELRFPDVIVTDLRLVRGQTGLDVIAAVQRYSGEPTPAVIVTGEDLGGTELEADGKTYAVVKKPVAADELRRRLIRALEEARTPGLDPG
jgi:two-component system, sensor histidine kinase